VLETHAAQKLIEAARPDAIRPRGLGAGLDVVQRLSTVLQLANDLPTPGAHAIARIVRRLA
jgi:hypothetical protein